MIKAPKNVRTAKNTPVAPVTTSRVFFEEHPDMPEWQERYKSVMGVYLAVAHFGSPHNSCYGPEMLEVLRKHANSIKALQRDLKALEGTTRTVGQRKMRFNYEHGWQFDHRPNP